MKFKDLNRPTTIVTWAKRLLTKPGSYKCNIKWPAGAVITASTMELQIANKNTEWGYRRIETDRKEAGTTSSLIVDSEHHHRNDS
jgi:hypothetical protein